MLVSSKQESTNQPECNTQSEISSNQIPTNISATSLGPIIIQDEESEDEVVIEGTIDKPEWTTSNVKLLLSWIEELHPLVGKCVTYRNKSDLWKEILRRFEEIGCLWTSSEVITKFSDLLREYKEATKNNNQIGSQHSSFPFKSELDRLISNPIQYNNGISYHAYWSKAKVDLLISSFEELHPVTPDTKNNMKGRNMWAEIHRRFEERGYMVTKKQLYTKFHGMLRQYKAEITRGVQTKRTDIGPWRSNLAAILKRWPKHDQDENEEDVDDPDAIGERNVENPSGEDTRNCNIPESITAPLDTSQSASDVKQNESSASQDRNMNYREARRQLTIECRKNREIKENYIRERQEYLKRKKEYLERKEAHMIRQEQLLESILQKLDKRE